jgi:hypothetical protein
MTEIIRRPDQPDLEKLSKEEAELHGRRLYQEFFDILTGTPEIAKSMAEQFLMGSYGPGPTNTESAYFKRGGRFFRIEVGHRRDPNQPLTGMRILVASHEEIARSPSFYPYIENWFEVTVSHGVFHFSNPEYNGMPGRTFNSRLALEKAEEVLSYLKAPVDTTNQESPPTEGGD